MSDKYIVYENDLKYKNFSNLDKSKIIFNDESVKKKFESNINQNTLELRFNDCKKENYLVLDLKYMDLKELPEFPDYLYSDLRELYLGNNNLDDSCLDKINKFKKLQVIELSYNKFKNLISLPNTLVELVATHNEISILPQNLDYVSVINVDSNLIRSVPSYPELTILNCDNNKVAKLGEYPKLKKLLCANNRLTEIINYPKLSYLDANTNQITKIKNCSLIRDLLISNNPLTELPSNFEKIKYLDLINTKISNLVYYKTLEELIANKNQIDKLDSNYKLSDARIHKDRLLNLSFNIK